MASSVKKFYNVFKMCIPEYLVDSDIKVNEPHLIACLVYTNSATSIVFEVIIPAEYADLFAQGHTAPDYHSGDLARKPVWGLSVSNVIGDDSELRNCDGVTAFECSCSSCTRVLDSGKKKMVRVVVSCDGAPLNMVAYHFDAEDDGSVMSVLTCMETPTFRKVDVKYEEPVEYAFKEILNAAQRSRKLNNRASTSATTRPKEQTNRAGDANATAGPAASTSGHQTSGAKRKHSQMEADGAESDDFTGICSSVLHNASQHANQSSPRRSCDSLNRGSSQGVSAAATERTQARSDRHYTFAKAMQDHVTLLDWLDLHRLAMQKLQQFQREDLPSRPANHPARSATNSDA